MIEVWVSNSEKLLSYIEAARVFDYTYKTERLEDGTYHLTIYTDKLLAAANKATKENDG